MKPVLIIAGALMALILGMIWHLSPAHAQARSCAPMKPLLDQLAKNFHEFVVITGQAAGEQRFMVTMSDKGTFSVLLSDGRQACIVIAGEKAELDNGI